MTFKQKQEDLELVSIQEALHQQFTEEYEEIDDPHPKLRLMLLNKYGLVPAAASWDTSMSEFGRYIWVK